MGGSILSFPERGPWGNAKWRGNCSGYVYKELFESLRPAVFVDPMVGSGTSIDVANDIGGIEAHGLDLHSGFDALTMSILQKVGKEADLVVSHPPYGSMVVYSGPGGMWGDKAHPNDLSRCRDDDDFNEKLHAVLLNQREATKAGGVYGTIIGDHRRDGVYSSYQAEILARMPRSELAGVLIKAQHNEMSSFKSYGRMRFPMIQHEYILLWKKPRQIMSALATLSAMAHDQAGRLRGTWKVIVRMVLVALGGKASLSDIYSQMSRHAPDRVAANENWMAKVRQTLQLHEDFTSSERGVWQLAA